MNKKLATLLFAIAAGVSATAGAQVSGASCMWTCKLIYDDCVRSGTDQLQCDLDRQDCYARCGI